MNSFLGDLRYTFRRARARMGFTAVAILSLGLGIGVNTAAFSLVNTIILRKTPMPQRDRVAEVYVTRGREVSGPFSYPDYADLRERSAGVFSQVAVSSLDAVPRDVGDRVETLIVEMVNGDYFPITGMQAAAGRLLGRPDDVTPGGHPVVVLGHDYWRKSFGANPSVVGTTLTLSGRPFTIVGVAPKALQGILPGLAPSLYVPVQMMNQVQGSERDEMKQRGNHSYFVRVRLADGQSFAAARLLLDRFVADMKSRYPDHWPASLGLGVYPLTETAVNPMMDQVIVPAATALMIVVALVLIVACTNLASFLLAQARDRQREIAIRLALGASRRMLVRQLLVESLTLAFIGGAVGIFLSNLALRALLGAQLPVPLPINLDVGLDLRVLGFVVAASVAAGIFFGLLPALQATRPNVIETIKNENVSARARRLPMRNVLVIAQTATSLVLLVTSALFLRSFAAQSRVDPGFGSAPAGLVWMALPPDRYDTTRRMNMVEEIERRMRTLPGVRHVGITGNILLNLLNQTDRAVNVDGFDPPRGEPGFSIQMATADSGYFDAVGVPLVSGRVFNSSDRLNTQPVAVINEAFANKFWPQSDAVGRTFRTGSINYRVIGITRTTKIRSLSEAPLPFFFLAYSQSPAADFHLVASMPQGDAAALATRMVGTLREIDPGFMIVSVKTMEQHLAAIVLPAQLGAVAFAVFAGLALVLAMMGVYGVVRYAVSRRSREVAIRLAVGARPDSVVRLLMREGVLLVGSGAVLGIALGFLMSRGLRALLYGVSDADPMAFVGAPLLLVVVGIIAAFLPARRASRVDPASTLRAE